MATSVVMFSNFNVDAFPLLPEPPFVSSSSSASVGADSTLYIVLGTVFGCCGFIAVVVVIVVFCKRRQVCHYQLHLLASSSSCLCRHLDPDILCWSGTLFRPDDLHDLEHDNATVTATKPSLEVTLQHGTHGFVALPFSEHLHSMHEHASFVRFSDHVTIHTFDPDVSLYEERELRMSAGNGISSAQKNVIRIVVFIHKTHESTLAYQTEACEICHHRSGDGFNP